MECWCQFLGSVSKEKSESDKSMVTQKSLSEYNASYLEKYGKNLYTQ